MMEKQSGDWGTFIENINFCSSCSGESVQLTIWYTFELTASRDETSDKTKSTSTINSQGSKGVWHHCLIIKFNESPLESFILTVLKIH
jgi:hypothetical protein